MPSQDPASTVITLLTDFGTQDWYVAAVKGVILQIAPQATIVDVTHNIGPQDVIRAAFVLRQTLEWFPPGTIHLAVVDPGVGSSRRLLAGRYAGQYVVAPDNGLITVVHRELPVEAVHQITNRAYALRSMSTTFHGRDIMAPARQSRRSDRPPPRRLQVTWQVEVDSLGRLCQRCMQNLFQGRYRSHLVLRL